MMQEGTEKSEEIKDLPEKVQEGVEMKKQKLAKWNMTMSLRKMRKKE